jgi:type IV secretory pathway TrbL component
MSGLFDFIPQNLIQSVMSSQTSRVIMAEALVAAAGAAAAVLAASRTDTGQRAGKAMADGGALMKEAAASAAAAARDVLASSATEAIGSAARSLAGVTKETQHALAKKAQRMKRDNADDMAEHDMAENARRYAERERPH